MTALAFPLVAGTGFTFLITAALFFYGITLGSAFFHTPKELSSGWTLANGIGLLLFSGLTLAGILITDLGVWLMVETVSFLAAFLTVSIGCSQIAAAITLKWQNLSGVGWMLLGGVLNLILSLLMFLHPILSWFALTTVWGVYLLVIAGSLLIQDWAAQRGAQS